MPGKVDERIVILDIDEKSLQEVARWPWPRDVMARLMNKLFDDYQLAIVGFDVVFAERDLSSGIGRLDELAQKELKQVAGFSELYQQIRPQLDNDGLFAKASEGSAGRAGVLPEQRQGRQADCGNSRSGAAQGDVRGPQDQVHELGRLRRQSAGVSQERRRIGALQPVRRRRRRGAPGADARRIRGPVLRGPVARDGAHAAGFPQGRAGLPARAFSA